MKITFQEAPFHYHGCPVCYASRSCMMDCSIEGGLYAGENLFGGYTICEYCERHYKACPKCRGTGMLLDYKTDSPSVYLANGFDYYACSVCEGSGAVFVGGWVSNDEFREAVTIGTT